MRKILLFFLILIPSYSYAQGTSINGVAFYNSSGTLRVIPSAVITVCIAVDVSIPCGDTVSIYSDVGLSVPKANPFNADANGNYEYFVASGSSYTETVTGVGVQGFSRQVGGGGSGSGTIGGSLVAGQIPVGSGPNTVAGSSTLTYVPTSPIGTLLQANSGGATSVGSATGCTGFNLVNTSVVTPATDKTYICKVANGYYYVDNVGEPDGLGGHYFNSLDMFADASISLTSHLQGGNSLTFRLDSASLTAGFCEIFNPGPCTNVSSPGLVIWDLATGSQSMFGATDGVAILGVAAHAGTPNRINIPTMTGTANYCFQTDGNSPQQTSWKQCVLVASLTTTAASSDNVTVTGMTASGHCTMTPTNSTASGLAAVPYISNKTTNQITVTHSVTSSATFDILCTPY